jgi:hypothetical protein
MFSPAPFIFISSINHYQADFFTVGISAHRIYEKAWGILFYRMFFQGLGVLTQPMLPGGPKPPENEEFRKINVKEIYCLQVRNTERCYCSGGEPA